MLIFYLLFISTLVGALGVVFSRNFIYAILWTLMATSSVSGILYLLKAKTLGAMTFWFLGISSTLVLLHVFFLIGIRRFKAFPRRFLFSKVFYIMLVLYVSLLTATVVPPFKDTHFAAFEVGFSDLTTSLQSDYAFAIILIFATAPFIMIGSLLLLRREEMLTKQTRFDKRD